MVAVNYDWDDIEDNIVEEYDDAGSPVAEYTTELGLYGNLISQDRQGLPSQYHFDAVGSTIALTDVSQQVTGSVAYTGFGKTSEQTGSAVSSFSYVGRKGYFANESLAEYRVRARSYVPRLTRWLSADPLIPVVATLLRRVHAYRYVHNTPITIQDPSGLLIPPPEPPRSPDQPNVIINRFGCRMTVGDYIVFEEVPRGGNTWLPVLKLNSEIKGRYPNDCREITYILAISVFERVPANLFQPGIPLVDVLSPELYAATTITGITGRCRPRPTILQEELDAMGRSLGRYATFTYDCWSLCEKCKCLSESGSLWISFRKIEIPIVVVKWTFTPLDLLPECEYEFCDVSLSVRQN